RSRAEVAAERDAKVPLRGRMGTAWDVANAALFLASDEANFITGVALAGRWRCTGAGRLINRSLAARGRSSGVPVKELHRRWGARSGAPTTGNQHYRGPAAKAPPMRSKRLLR